MLPVRRVKTETDRRAVETFRKTLGSVRAAVASAAGLTASPALKCVASGRHHAPTLQTGSSKSVSQNNRWQRLPLRALRQTPLPNIPAECCQNHRVSAPGPQKTDDDSR